MGRGRSAFAPAAAASRPTRIPRRGTVDASAAVAPEEAAVSFDAHPIETGAIAAHHGHAACRVIAACPPRGGQTRPLAFSFSVQISEHPTDARWRPHADARFEGCRFWC